eukprot:m.24024 g.24024  ORF g.24024 m.24024 type:complete len:55 (-) comp7566_c0_seq1:285-449(-)
MAATWADACKRAFGVISVGFIYAIIHGREHTVVKESYNITKQDRDVILVPQKTC